MGRLVVSAGKQRWSIPLPPKQTAGPGMGHTMFVAGNHVDDMGELHSIGMWLQEIDDQQTGKFGNPVR
jgi:hypothetical protein